MPTYQHFRVASYVHAEYLHDVTDEALERGIAAFQRYLPLDKAYLETHRGLYDIPAERMRAIQALFAAHGIAVAGGITSTIKIDGHEKNSIFDVLCYTDPVYRARYLDIVRETAALFDEIILDDFFFTACRCEMCLDAKGERSWAEFRLEQMADMAREMVAAARAVNPDVTFVIKYPNWYESYQECGYNPGVQKDIFDGIYTGTESRDPRYSQQHLQRYLSYSLVRYLENLAPGRNGGGWIDQGGSSDNVNTFLEQASLTLFARARELTLFNFADLIDSLALPPLGRELARVDALLGKVGQPRGVAVYEPCDASGEDQLMNYLGMLGLPLEPSPAFDESAPALLLTQSAAHDPDILPKLRRYVRQGGHAVMTIGFFHATYERGIQDMTSARLTPRRVWGQEYWMDNYYANRKTYAQGMQPVGLEVLEYKTNATWCEIALVSGDCNFPLLLDDFYGQGHLYLLNVPDNFSDLYRLPAPVLTALRKALSRGLPAYLGAAARYGLLLYDDDTLGVHSFRPHAEAAEIVLRGQDVRGLEDLETGETFRALRDNPRPVKRFDSAKTEAEPLERVYALPLEPGCYRFLRILRQR